MIRVLKILCGVAVALLVLASAGDGGPPTPHGWLLASYEGDYAPLTALPTRDTAAPGISPFDEVFRQEGARAGYDWLLLAAIAYRESRFDHRAVSPRGARGLMQIMPATARRLGIHGERIVDPRTNVRLATRLLLGLERSLRLPATMPENERTRILLAAYNAGIGHVIDARRLARRHAADPNRWADVSDFLALKADSLYYADSSLSSGAFRGARETIAFVSAVERRYRAYQLKMEN